MTHKWQTHEKPQPMDGPHNSGFPTVVLSIIIPAYNEELTIISVVHRVLQTEVAQTLPIEVIIVDDGSTDGTWRKLNGLPDDARIKRLRHHANRGKGHAIRTALTRVRGKFTVIQDADLEYDPNDLKPMLRRIQAGGTKAVFGSRYLTKEKGQRWKNFRWLSLGVVVLNRAAQCLYGVKTTDLCTCYKMMETSLLNRADLQSNGFEFCSEITAKLALMDIAIDEVPIRYSPRSVGDGKKIRWQDGLQLLRALWRYRNWQVPPPDVTSDGQLATPAFDGAAHTGGERAVRQ